MAAQVGDKVKVAYTGTLADGTVFDKSKGEDFLEFTIGDEQIIPAFEQAIIGMDVDQEKQFQIPAAEAYGEYSEDNVVEVTRSSLPDNLEPQVGQKLEAKNREGDPVIVKIAKLDKNTVTLDANHDLAGKDLNFAIALKGIGEE
ncbi:MAG: peptidylprolyl isomerase [Chitinivibrionales bacterium]|nr:peptidylprolyl isomerase [Chitinivibrionales bacterium]